MLRRLPSLIQTNASSSTALSFTSLTRMVVICRRCTFQEHISIRSNSVGFYYFECCCSLATLPRALVPHTLCVSFCIRRPFDCCIVLIAFFAVLTCMRTHIVVSSCHLNAVRSLSYSADCLSIGCVNTCVYSFVRHLIRGRDFSIKSLQAEVDESVSSISGTWQTTLTSNPMV